MTKQKIKEIILLSPVTRYNWQDKAAWIEAVIEERFQKEEDKNERRK